MENVLNAFVYCNYLIQIRLHYLFNRINPACLLLYIPFIKKKFERKNQDPWEEFNKIFTDKKDGLSIWYAYTAAIGTIFVYIISSVLLINRIFDFDSRYDKFYFIVSGGISMMIGYLYMLKYDKYLDYFDEFEKWTRTQKRKYVVISFLVIIASIVYFFMSLMCC